jgi:hypothetical protein
MRSQRLESRRAAKALGKRGTIGEDSSKTFLSLQPISTFIDLELGLKETSLLSTLKPAASNRPTGVHIGLLGASYCVRRMLERCVAIAQRPLALLLTPENRHAYERVSNLIELFLQFVTKSIQNGT